MNCRFGVGSFKGRLFTSNIIITLTTKFKSFWNKISLIHLFGIHWRKQMSRLIFSYEGVKYNGPSYSPFGSLKSNERSEFVIHKYSELCPYFYVVGD